MEDKPDTRQSRFMGTPQHELGLRDTALLIIDMQYLDAHLDYGICRHARDAGEDLAYYDQRLKLAVPNIADLLAAFRIRKMEVIYSHIASLTPDGRDRSLSHKKAGIHAPPGSREAQILEEIAPVSGEIVLSKTVASVFAGTMIDYVLRNIGISTIVLAGVLTSGCVYSAMHDAYNRNYNVVLVEDACADLDREFHKNSIDVFRVAAMVTSTRGLIERLPVGTGA